MVIKGDESSGYSLDENMQDDDEVDGDDSDDSYYDEDDREEGSGNSVESGQEDSNESNDEDVVPKRSKSIDKVPSEAKTFRQKSKNISNIPLYKLLAQQQQAQAVSSSLEQADSRRNRDYGGRITGKKRPHQITNDEENESDGEDDEENHNSKKKRKNAPAEMRNDKPVRR